MRAISVLLVLFAVPGCSAVDGPDVALAFSRTPAFASLGSEYDVRVTFDPATDVWHFDVAENGNGASRQFSVTGQNCPLLVSSLKALEDLELPNLRLQGLHDEINIVGDGVSYEMKTSSAYPGKASREITLGSNVDTPLALWTDRMIDDLLRCEDASG